LPKLPANENGGGNGQDAGEIVQSNGMEEI
jgi:hypothetical protein